MARARSHAAVILASAAYALGCSADPQVHGEFVTLQHPAELTPCAGTIGYLDRAYVAIADAIELPEADRQRIDYHLQPDGVPCDGARGCASDDGRTVWAQTADLTHELVHALQIQLTGELRHPFLSEGLAVALGGPEGALMGDYDALRANLDPDTAPIDADLAGDFVSYLIEAHGFPAFERLLRATTRRTDADTLEAAFEAIYGMPLQALIEERLASGLFFPQARLGIPQCVSEVAPWSGRAWTAALALDCDGAGAIGPVLEQRRRWNVAYDAFEVPSDGVYAFEIEGSEGVAEIANPCGPLPLPIAGAHRVGLGGRRLVFTQLARGRHFIKLAAAQDRSQNVALRVTQDPAADRSDCPEAVMPVDGAIDGLHLAARSSDRFAVRFAPAMPLGAKLLWWGLRGAEICSGACSALDCRTLATLAPDVETLEVQLELPAEPHLLRFESVNPAIGLAWLRLDFVR